MLNCFSPCYWSVRKDWSGSEFSAGLDAGANVLSVNFTPDDQRENYLIYGKDRYIVRNDHLKKIAGQSGLKRATSAIV